MEQGSPASNQSPPRSETVGATRERVLERSVLFSRLSPQLRTQLAPRFGQFTIEAGSEILKAGQPSDGLYVIAGGRVGVVARNKRSASTQIIATLGPGESIGEASVVSGAPCATSFIAMEPVALMGLSRKAVEDLMARHPEVSHLLLQRLAELLNKSTGIGSIPWSDLKGWSFDKRLWESVPFSVSRTGRLCPLSVTGTTMTVAMVDPRDIQLLDELATALPGVQFRVVVATEEDIRNFVNPDLVARLGRVEIKRKPVSSRTSVPKFSFEYDEEPGTARRVGKDIAPAITAVKSIVGLGLAVGASDIHLEPERDDLRVRYRVDGILKPLDREVPADLAKPIASRLKLLARLDITETRKPQDGRISVRMHSGKMIDLRISTLPAKFGEKVALRILDSADAIKDLGRLFVVDNVRRSFAQLIAKKTGFVLVTGPTGSGKSTTLYSALNACRKDHLNIMTVEDPIEYHLDGITQVEAHPHTGINFATVLRSLLRQDPNIIMIGEMRDEETARIAIEASLTGHLVFSSLHTNGTLQAIARLRDMGIEPYAIANGLAAVVHQRLVQKVCPSCARPFEYPGFIVELLSRHGVLSPDKETQLLRGEGCEECNGTGLLGRVGVYGLLMITGDVRDAIARDVDIVELRRAAARGSHFDLAQYAGFLLRSGLTVPGEILPILQSETAVGWGETV
jgi:type II secretory ATPase GspE/PulE/Tfp pilus assembly ATPase PilB-like protein